MGIRAARLDRTGVPSASAVDAVGIEQRLADALGASGLVGDPVCIVAAAQVHLRRLRRLISPVAPCDPDTTARIQAIVRTRDALLRRALADSSASAAALGSRGGEARGV
ncbi:MAG: hypothetical protein ACKON8_11970 [Planctomycetota bacterium]